MDAKDKLIRARIQIQNRSPFFAYLSLYLKFVEVPEEDNDTLSRNSAGVDTKGNLYYKAKWVEEELNDEEVIGLILHEIMHLGFVHLLRRGNRNPIGWNICTDIAVNKIILDNGFRLPPKGIIPEDNEVTLFGQTIKGLDKKSAEVLYDELKLKEEQKNGKGSSGNSGFDKHIEGKDLTPEEKKKMENDWLNKVEEAYVGAKMRGQVPSGIERLISNLHKSRVNWKAMLQKYIQSYIPYDYTYCRPNKKSISAGFYMPDYLKEKIHIAVTIDTSGSIGQKELTDFLSEIVGLARSYQNRIDMRLICHDTEVCEDLLINNGNIDKIKNLKCKGGGGTSHEDVFKHIEKNMPECKVALFLTDGYSDLGTMDFKERFAKIFLISQGGDSSWAQNKHCKIIHTQPEEKWN